jgi:uncharacterized protein
MKTRFLTAGLAFALAAGSAVALSGSAEAASYSCHEVSGKAERTICGSWRLNALDERMAYWYGRALERARYFDQTSWIRSSQRRWLSARNVCGSNIGCLTYSYQRRIWRLKNYVEHV